jgi:hypothetical protein
VNIWVVGNGQSRQSFALNQIQDHTIGCNAVHRDSSCTEFVAVDLRMVNEILSNEQHKDKIVYTRQDWAGRCDAQRVRTLPDPPFKGTLKADDPFHWNSGPLAVILAASYNPKEIHLLGFDLWDDNGTVNNLYKGTVHYAAAKSNPVSPEFWIYQLERTFRHYYNIHFIQYQKDNWRIPDSWLSINNLTIKNISV